MPSENKNKKRLNTFSQGLRCLLFSHVPHFHIDAAGLSDKSHGNSQKKGLINRLPH